MIPFLCFTANICSLSSRLFFSDCNVELLCSPEFAWTRRYKGMCTSLCLALYLAYASLSKSQIYLYLLMLRPLVLQYSQHASQRHCSRSIMVFVIGCVGFVTLMRERTIHPFAATSFGQLNNKLFPSGSPLPLLLHLLHIGSGWSSRLVFSGSTLCFAREYQHSLPNTHLFILTLRGQASS